MPLLKSIALVRCFIAGASMQLLLIPTGGIVRLECPGKVSHYLSRSEIEVLAWWARQTVSRFPN